MGQQTTGFLNNRMYESDRHSVKLSHNDFASDADNQFEYRQENDDLNDFLLSKDWDRFFTQSGPYAQRKCETSIANNIFQSVLDKFQFRMDTVQIFHIITQFYDVDAKIYFEKLVQKYRKHLQKDLEHRIGRLQKTSNVKIGDDKIRMTFESLFITK
jgi:hypothetical protein